MKTVPRLMRDGKMIFSLSRESDGGYVAECLSHDIFTQGDTWEGARQNILAAVNAYFFDHPQPRDVWLRFEASEIRIIP